MIIYNRNKEGKIDKTSTTFLESQKTINTTVKEFLEGTELHEDLKQKDEKISYLEIENRPAGVHTKGVPALCGHIHTPEGGFQTLAGGEVRFSCNGGFKGLPYIRRNLCSAPSNGFKQSLFINFRFDHCFLPQKPVCVDLSTASMSIPFI